MGDAFDDLSDRSLYVCTSDRPDLASFIKACVKGGVDIVQLRDKHLEDRRLLIRATLAASVCRDYGVPFILNDRTDLAVAAGADGVHLGQDDAPPALARQLLGEKAVVGLSTHRPTELAASASEPVDYVSVGPVSATPTKPGRPGTGLAYVRHATAHGAHPYWVTGGVRPDTVGPMIAAGARRFVVVRWLTDADDPGRSARELRHAIDTAIERCALGGADAQLD